MRFLPLIALLLTSAQVDARLPSITKYQQLELEEITVGALREKYEKDETSVQEVTQAYLERIEAVDFSGPKLNSIIALNPDALKVAAQLDREFKDGKIRGPLHGIPIILKDNIDTLDPMPNTAGANVLKNSFPKRDAFIVQKLKENGAIILAKANLSEWANFHSTIFSSGWSAVGGQTKNPYDLTRNPCGSSSGSGVSISANLAVISIGTDTEGSITCPANSSGIVGIRPTVGLLSRSSIIPISQTADTPGPMARNVTDAVIALGAMVGIDKNDSATLRSEGKYHLDYTQFLKKNGLAKKRIGIYREILGKHFKVDRVFEEAISYMRSQGAEIVEVEKLVAEDAPNFTVLLHEFKDGLN